MSPLMRTAVIAFVAFGGFACGSAGGGASEAQQSQQPSAAAQVLGGLARSGFTGTVVVKDAAAGESTTNDSIAASTTKTSLNASVVLTVTTNGVVANVTYASKTVFEQTAEYQAHRVVGTKTEETTASGHSTENASVTVDLRSDGTYQINFSGGGVTGEYRMVDTAETICKPNIEGSTCRPYTSSSEDSGKPPNQGGVAGSVDGRIDEKQPKVLVGSEVQRHELNDGSTATRTVTWNLSR